MVKRTYNDWANWLRYLALIIGLACSSIIFFSGTWVVGLILAFFIVISWWTPIFGVILIAWGSFGLFLLFWALSSLGYATGPTTSDLLFAIFNSIQLIVGILFLVSAVLRHKTQLRKVVRSKKVYECEECGTEISETNKSCPKCGVEFEGES